jgi:hypothetical protein
MKIDIDEGIYQELAGVAKKKRRDIGQLVNQIISNYCKQQTILPGTAAPSGYKLRPEEKKGR